MTTNWKIVKYAKDEREYTLSEILQFYTQILNQDSKGNVLFF
jgi:hypothetical protein